MRESVHVCVWQREREREITKMNNIHALDLLPLESIILRRDIMHDHALYGKYFLLLVGCEGCERL